MYVDNCNVLVVLEDPTTLEAVLEPYRELRDYTPGRGMEFVDFEDNQREDYETLGVLTVTGDTADEDGSYSPGDLLPSAKVGYRSTSEYKSYKELYSTFEEYMESLPGVCVRHPETGRYGIWVNPQAKFSSYRINKGLSSSFLTKDGQFVLTPKIEDLVLVSPAEMLAFLQALHAPLPSLSISQSLDLGCMVEDSDSNEASPSSFEGFSFRGDPRDIGAFLSPSTGWVRREMVKKGLGFVDPPGWGLADLLRGQNPKHHVALVQYQG